jgi:hypothetical protein
MSNVVFVPCPDLDLSLERIPASGSHRSRMLRCRKNLRMFSDESPQLLGIPGLLMANAHVALAMVRIVV